MPKDTTMVVNNAVEGVISPIAPCSASAIPSARAITPVMAATTNNSNGRVVNDNMLPKAVEIRSAASASWRTAMDCVVFSVTAGDGATGGRRGAVVFACFGTALGAAFATA